ncbi:hypothetical protein DPEC_G00139590 [Dallia pectoralis]|uniref:Uncharacterized protein n=1 Tax=Dallia pectoralis TaxID=75939 RepID=A0ACC2GM72_DALPE|nr:hypothetical protein DPEC_G00139590 [Dallia pectoralis]
MSQGGIVTNPTNPDPVVPLGASNPATATRSSPGRTTSSATSRALVAWNSSIRKDPVMFFYPNVLNRHTGCFSTIWLAATKGIRIQRRDYMKVNVYRTCNDIMDYVLVRVPPLQPGLPRPRFSLYLSSQLLYGVVIVYHRQCGLQLEDIQHILDKLAKTRRAQNIDVDVSDRHTLCLPDMLSFLEESEWAANPFFGQMQSEYQMPSPNTLIQLGGQFGVKRPLLQSPGTPSLDGITASPESITLIERQPITIPAAEFEGADLKEVTDQDMGIIDLLMDQLDQFSEWEIEQKRTLEREERERMQESEGGAVGEGDLEKDRELEQEVGRAREEEIERTRDLTGSLIGMPLGTISSEDPTLLGEDIVLPMEMTAGLTEERSPESVPLPSEPVRKRKARPLQAGTPPGKTPRRRQLLFFDKETQISQVALQQQRSNTLVQTRPLVVVSDPSNRRVSSTELLDNPCTNLPPELLSLWKQAAVITALTGSDLQVGRRGTDSESAEGEREQEVIRERVTEGELGYKVPRELTETGLSQPDVSSRSLLLESSDKDVGWESPLSHTPESRGSPVLRSGSKLTDIPEEGERLLEREAEDIPVSDQSTDLQDQVAEALRDYEGVLFHSLLPPLAKRRSVTHSFWILLEIISSRRVLVQQDEPYGDINILPGPNYEEE